MTARIDRLWPDAVDDLSDDDLLAMIDHAGVRVNFVSSIDGAATRDGRSGGLSGPADKRFFELLRRVSDVVLVGAGTVRDEGYGAMRVSDDSAAWRVANGRSPHPVFAIVTGSLDLDPASGIFTEAPVRPVVVTTEGAVDTERFAEVADIVAAGDGDVDAAAAVAALREMGFRQLLCEGGPTLFGSFLEADVVDEFCVTISPSLEGGDAPRIANGGTARDMRLAVVLRSRDELLLRYAAARPSASRIV